MTPETIQNLVTKAFTLEVLADKPGCTTRFQDLPEKPLEAFVLAGINSSPYFQLFAADRLSGSSELYQYFVPALKASNQHKSPKYINLGLLEMLFNAVAARLACDDPEKVIDQINIELKKSSSQDADWLIDARRLAWSTTTNAQKKEIIEAMSKQNFKSPYGLKQWLVAATPRDSASSQWGEQAVAGWPVLRKLYEGLRASDKQLMLDKVADAYQPVVESSPDLKIGLLADMTAAAIFLYLSFE